ncbi:serine O-acetyltransferase [Methylotenera sp. N17]|uniref:serine O-acetyltransferase n=1 Tax=Methylotenera sp. N17 TaxID=1502761 RepID=UPI000645DE78|nr:serine acetyltransferase [Methylotenera sp. N17]
MTNSEVSAETPDWQREKKSLLEWAPPRALLASIRRYQHADRYWLVIARVIKIVAVLQHRFWSAVTGADIPINTQIGGGLLIPHPNGIVIHPGVSIGPNCLILQQVTLGSNEAGDLPAIGGHVDIGAGAKLIGKVHVGNHAKIGANAVVLIDVPAYATAVGVPAKIISKPEN